MGQWLERYRWLLFLGIVVLVLGALVLFQVLRPEPQPTRLSTAIPLPTQSLTPTPYAIRVYVSGAVHSPDVYTLLQDSIVKDAMEAAGGPTGDADLERINLALPVSDGQHVHVPRKGEDNPPVQPPSGQPAPGGKVNINTADPDLLESLPGIGPALAQRIVDHRQTHGLFERIEDITEVSGIGDAIFESIQDLITTR